MCLHCVCKVSDGFSNSSGTSWFPRACTIWALTKPLLKSSVKMAKFKTLSFCQKLFWWNQPSSCKCSMCLHFVYKVSECFSESCGTSWIPHICTTFAPLRITKGNNSNRTGPKPLIFYYKCTSYQYQCICKVWWISIIAFSRYQRKTKNDRKKVIWTT